MKKLAILLLAILVYLPAEAATLTGTIKHPNGTRLNGRLRMTLSHPARDSSDSTVVVPTVVEYRVSNGALPSTARLASNDNLQPRNTYYLAEYFDSFGRKLMQNAFIITGTAFNLGAAQPTSITTSNISFADLINLNLVTSKNIGGIRFAASFTGGDFCQKVAAAIGDLPATGGTVMTHGLEGVQTCASNPLSGVTKPVVISFGASTISASVKWTIPSNTTIYGNGTTIKYTGASTSRLWSITGDNVSVSGSLTLSGNSAQPYGALVYVHDNVDNLSMSDLTIRDIAVTSHGLNMTNQVYGLTISPYGVKNFKLSRLHFENLTSTNNPGVTGEGFVGAVMFMRYVPGTPEVFDPLTTSQLDGTFSTEPSSGSIDNCSFENIVTNLAGGLSDGDRGLYDDADAIRATTPATGSGVLRVDLRVSNCRFRKVSKRAIKWRIDGLMVSNIDVVADANVYPMSAVIDVDGEAIVDGVRVYSAAGSLQPDTVFSLSIAHRTVISNVISQACDVWMAIQADSTWALTRTLGPVTISNIQADNITGGAIIQSTTAVAANYSFSGSHLKFRGISDGARGIEMAGNSIDGISSIRFYDVELVNLEFKISGEDNIVDGLFISVDRAGWTGSAAARELLEFGTTPGIATKYNVLKNVTINVSDCLNTYVNATRTHLFSIFGDNVEVRNLSVRVPTGLSASFAHGSFYGNHMLVDGVNYFGHGFLFFSNEGASLGGVYRNLTRLGHGIAASNLFVSATNAQRARFENVVDYRTSTAVVISLGGSTILASIDGVAGATSNAELVTGGGGGLASIRNEMRLNDLSQKSFGRTVAGNNEILDTKHERLIITAGSPFTGVTLSAPPLTGRNFVLIHSGGGSSVTLANPGSPTVRFGSGGGTPVMGPASGEVMSMTFTEQGGFWVETGRILVP